MINPLGKGEELGEVGTKYFGSPLVIGLHEDTFLLFTASKELYHNSSNDNYDKDTPAHNLWRVSVLEGGE